MSKEKFKDIKGYEGYYQVSNLGNVKSVTRFIKYINGRHRYVNERILKTDKTKKGYLLVTLSANGINIKHSVHRLVALAFINNNNNKPQVNHIDGNRSNNNVNNLEWVSRRENVSHGVRNRKTSSKYIGVTYRKDSNSWGVSLSIYGKNKYLGVFNNEYDAHKAYLIALEKNNIKNKYAQHD